MTQSDRIDIGNLCLRLDITAREAAFVFIALQAVLADAEEHPALWPEGMAVELKAVLER